MKTGHVGINVTDVARSSTFYRSIFGLETIAESDETDRSFALLGADGELVVALWGQGAGGFDRTTPGLHHLSFQVDSPDEVSELADKARSAGAEFLHEEPVSHAEGWASGGVFFTDPDGIRLEVFSPTGYENAPAPNGAYPTCALH